MAYPGYPNIVMPGQNHGLLGLLTGGTRRGVSRQKHNMCTRTFSTFIPGVCVCPKPKVTFDRVKVIILSTPSLLCERTQSPIPPQVLVGKPGSCSIATSIPCSSEMSRRELFHGLSRASSSDSKLATSNGSVGPACHVFATNSL